MTTEAAVLRLEAMLQTKLAAINATIEATGGTSISPEGLLAMLLTVDGAGSQLDADLLDGIESARVVSGSHDYASTRVDAPSDFNTILRSGFYTLNLAENAPPASASWWHLIHLQHSNTSYCLQLARGMTGNTGLYHRAKDNNGFGPWMQLATLDDVPQLQDGGVPDLENVSGVLLYGGEAAQEISKANGIVTINIALSITASGAQNRVIAKLLDGYRPANTVPVVGTRISTVQSVAPVEIRPSGDIVSYQGLTNGDLIRVSGSFLAAT